MLAWILQGLQLGGAHKCLGISLIDLELIGYVQLFTEPHYALRLRPLEVVNNEHGRNVVRAPGC